jgi:single-strand DNA-binding protein
MSVNKVTLMGNITRDPELKYLPSQTAVCDISLAVNRTWTGQDGVKKEETTFVDCSAFGKTAEVISKHFHKGKPILVFGRLKMDQWEAQDGSKRSKMRVVIEEFTFLPRDSSNNGGGQGGYGGEPEQPQRQANRGAQDRAPRGHGGPTRGARTTAASPAYDADDAAPLPDDVMDDLPF